MKAKEYVKNMKSDGTSSKELAKELYDICIKIIEEIPKITNNRHCQTDEALEAVVRQQRKKMGAVVRRAEKRYGIKMGDVVHGMFDDCLKHICKDNPLLNRWVKEVSRG